MCNFSYIITACDTIRLLSKSFSTLILSSVTVTEFPGVDISREERIQKCKICHSRFVEIQSCLKELEKTPGKVGAATSETLEELGVFS